MLRNSNMNEPCAGLTDEQQSALRNLREAVLFFDRVKASSGPERTAVGSDHWDWLETAARHVVEQFPN